VSEFHVKAPQATMIEGLAKVLHGG